MTSALLIDGAMRRLPHRYVVSPVGEYAHLPRSAARYDRRLVVTALCGTSFNDPIVTDEPAGPLCGTCLGREMGLTEHGVAYRPRMVRSLPKRWCAGPRNDLWVPVDGRLGRCLACGQVVPQRARRSPWSYGVTLVAHGREGRGVACPEHGARNLGVRDGRVVCRQWKCDRVALPFWLLRGHP